MTGGLTLGAALILGIAASGHCLLMCGGISSALGLASAGTAEGRPRVPLIVAYQVGRIVSYAMAGAIVAALFLRRFVPEGVRWAHVDLYAWNDASRPGRPEGGEIQAARAIARAVTAFLGSADRAGR